MRFLKAGLGSGLYSTHESFYRSWNGIRGVGGGIKFWLALLIKISYYYLQNDHHDKECWLPVLSVGADQLKRPEIEEWKHDSEILAESDAFPVSQVKFKSVKDGRNGK